MPDVSGQSQALFDWLSTNGLLLAALALVLLFVYRWARPAIHRVLIRVMAAQAKALGEAGGHEAETEKRVATLEDLFTKLLRLVAVGALVAVVLGMFDLWSVLAGLGVVLAAITLAGQSIVLDYLMGVLILVEGQYFKGDLVRINAIEGTVEEVGLRRTLVRDVRGTLHSISNGDIRTSANLTRTYAVALVNVEGIADRDLDAAAAVIGEVAADLAADPELGGLFLEPPAYAGATSLTAAGATLRLSGRVRPEHRLQVEMEMRRRVAAALAARSIEPIRPAMGTAPRG